MSPTLHDDDDDDDDDDECELKVGEEHTNTPNKIDVLNQQKWRIQQASRL